jgi:hypothetical protein
VYWRNEIITKILNAPSGTEEYHHALQEGQVGTLEEFLVLSDPQEEPAEEAEAEARNALDTYIRICI